MKEYIKSESIALHGVGYNEDVIAFDISEDVVHILNSTAAHIVKLLENKMNIESITAHMSEIFDAPESEVKRDIIEVIPELIAKKIIMVVGS